MMTEPILRPSHRRVLRCLARGYALVQFRPDQAMLDWWEHSPPDLGCPDKTEVSAPCFRALRMAGLITVAKQTDDEVWWVPTEVGQVASARRPSVGVT